MAVGAASAKEVYLSHQISEDRSRKKAELLELALDQRQQLQLAIDSQHAVLVAKIRAAFNGESSTQVGFEDDELLSLATEKDEKPQGGKLFAGCAMTQTTNPVLCDGEDLPPSRSEVPTWKSVLAVQTSEPALPEAASHNRQLSSGSKTSSDHEMLRELAEGGIGQPMQSESNADLSHLNLSRHYSRLDTFVGAMIMLNSLFLLLDLEWEGSQTAVLLGQQEVHGWSGAKPLLDVMEHIFTVVFILELVFRIWMEKRAWCRSAMNLFDAFLVLVSCIDIYVLTPLTQGPEGSVNNVVLLRLLRTTRLIRAVRIVRTLRLFRGLRVLVQACTSFLPSLCWSMILLGLLMMMGGLMIGNLLQDYLKNTNEDVEMRRWIWRHYGTAYRSIYTMYEMTFAGNWPVYARPVLEEVGHSLCIFYILYITVVVFAIIRVITAIFLRDTLEAAQSDAEHLVHEKMVKRDSHVRKLEKVFKALDISGDGLVSEGELLKVLQDDKVRTYLQALDVDVHETAALFRLLDDGDGAVTLDEFINGMLRFKGPARSIDLIAMHMELKDVTRQNNDLRKAMEKKGLIERIRRHSRTEPRRELKHFRHCDTYMAKEL